MRREPEDYPWPVPASTGQVTATGFDESPALDAHLLTGRTPVVAVGSNASPQVLRDKLRAHLEAGVPIQPVRVSGLSVGHSAHISRPGFVAAAPARTPGRNADVCLTWLTTDQLTVIDATEPNYHRRKLPATTVLADSGPVTGAQIYDSKHGVLADRGGQVLPLRAQAGVTAWLQRHVPGFDAADLRDPARQQWLRSRFIELGLRRDSGLQ